LLIIFSIDHIVSREATASTAEEAGLCDELAGGKREKREERREKREKRRAALARAAVDSR
jgi:hypothetical protein